MNTFKHFPDNVVDSGDFKTAVKQQSRHDGSFGFVKAVA